MMEYENREKFCVMSNALLIKFMDICSTRLTEVKIIEYDRKEDNRG